MNIPKIQNRPSNIVRTAKTIIAIIIIYLSGAIANAKARYPQSFFDSLSTMPIKKIIEKGYSCQNADSAMAYYTVAIAKYESNPAKYKGFNVWAYTNAGYTSLYPLRNFNDAYYYLRQAENAAREIGDSAVMATITLNLANVFIGADDLSTALSYSITFIEVT